MPANSRQTRLGPFGRPPATALSSQRTHWQAFRQAALRSERLRAVGLLGAIGIGVSIAAVRLLVAGTEGQQQLFVQVLALVGGLAAYELGMLVAVGRAIRAGRLLSDWVWATSLLVEALLPTLAIWLLTVTAYTYARHGGPPPLDELFPLQIYATQAALLLLGGVVAAWVAQQVREHVFGALREAEARRRAERLERNLEIARSIQRGLLPGRQTRSPAARGVDARPSTAVRLQPRDRLRHPLPGSGERPAGRRGRRCRAGGDSRASARR